MANHAISELGNICRLVRGLVQNESDKKIKPKLAIKRNFKSSKSLDGDNNKQNHSENTNSHVQLSITCCSSTVSLLNLNSLF